MLKNKQRKAWHADLKWLFGLLAAILLTISLTSLAMYRLSADSGLNKAKEKIASEEPGKGSADIGHTEDKDGKASKSISEPKIILGDKEYTPEELKNMDEKEVQALMKKYGMDKGSGSWGKDSREKGKGDISKPEREIFSEGGINPKMISEMMGSQMSAMAGPMFMPAIIEFMDNARQGTYFSIFLSTLIGALLFLIPMIIFSHRWGRIVSPSVVLLIASLPVFIFNIALKGGGMFGAISKKEGFFSVIGSMADVNYGLFLGLVLTAAVLILGSVALSLAMSIFTKKPAEAKK